MKGEHRVERTIPGDLGGSWWDIGGLGEKRGKCEMALALVWRLGVEGDTLDMGDRDEDLRLD